jgi:hypothetical protein
VFNPPAHLSVCDGVGLALQLEAYGFSERGRIYSIPTVFVRRPVERQIDARTQFNIDFSERAARRGAMSEKVPGSMVWAARSVSKVI